MTRRQQSVLYAIRDLTCDGMAPTIREIAEHLGLRGVSSVHRSIEQLEAEGRIVRGWLIDGRREARGLRLTDGAFA